jgi:hypothetical protein
LPSEQRLILVEPDPARALDCVLELGAETILVCGSIYLIGTIRSEIRRRWGFPPAATATIAGAPGGPRTRPAAG